MYSGDNMKKEEEIEELHLGNTINLEPVIERTKEIKERKYIESKRKEAMVTCRVLFISILDKIFLFTIFSLFIILTIFNFMGNIKSFSYEFSSRVGKELFILLCLTFLYILLNWIYKCACKTMLSLTRNQIYEEIYFPLYRKEKTIPINQIASVSTINFLWVFRSIIIKQNHQFPLIFFTWKNKKLKSELENLMLNTDIKVKNSYQTKNILNKKQLPMIGIFAIFVITFIIILGVIHLIFRETNTKMMSSTNRTKEYSIKI